MENVQSLIGLPGEEANEIVLSSEEHQERELRYGEPCRPYTEGLVVLATRDVVIGEFECEDRGEVEEEKDDCAE